MIRTPIALVPYIFAFAAALGGLLWSEGDRVARLGATRTSGTALVGGPFRLIDQNGRARSDGDFRGRFMLIYFGYSFCPDVCPTTLALMANALEKTGAKATRVVPVFISIDPERDTPSVLKPYMKSFGPGFVALTGDIAQIKQVAAEYHVYVRKHPLPGGNYAMDHSGVIYLMGPDGKFVTYYEDTLGPDGIADDLKRRL